MALNEKEINELSMSSINVISEALPGLEPADITALYNAELSASSPRKGVIDLLLPTIEKEDDVEEEVVVEADPDAFKPKETYAMVWRDETKCIIQGKRIFNSVTHDFIEKIK